MKEKPQYKVILKYKIFIIGFIISIAFWFVESLLHFLFFSNEFDFISLFFTPTLHELWMRIAGVAFIIIFSIVSNYFFIRVQQSKRKIKHVSSVLKAIRHVNQLITREKDREELVQKSCDILIETRGFLSVWIVLLDQALNLIFASKAGIGEVFELWEEIFKKGELPKCLILAMEQKKSAIIKNPQIFCDLCPLAKSYGDRVVMTSRLEYKRKIFGVITISLPKEMGDIEEEKDLFDEVASDIAFAINNIDLEQVRIKAEKDLKESLSRTDFYKDLLAHDISNILNNIKSSVQLTDLWKGDPAKSNKKEELMEIIKTQLDRGASLVSNVRKLSEVYERNQVIKAVNVKLLLEKTLQQIRIQFIDKAIEIQSIFPKIPIKNINGSNLLLDVFENILRNGVIHNESDVIKLWIKVAEIEEDLAGFVKIEFMDNGVGIIDDRKKNIFKKHYTRNRSTGGMGIGLSLVKQIINDFEGKVWVEDRIKGDHTQGSNFVILLKEM